MFPDWGTSGTRPVQDARHEPKQRALAGPVAADHAQRVAAVNGQRYVIERLVLTMFEIRTAAVVAVRDPHQFEEHVAHAVIARRARRRLDRRRAWTTTHARPLAAPSTSKWPKSGALPASSANTASCL